MKDFAALMEATWPAAETRDLGPFRLRRGAGGGQRVSAASKIGPFEARDIDLAEAAMRQMHQQPLFMVAPRNGDLDQALEARGYRVKDPVVIYHISCAMLAGPEGPERMTTFPHWPPMAIARALWTEGHIDAPRIAVMERACTPKTAILGRADDRASGVVFAAITDQVAFAHALHVTPALRRKKSAQNILRAVGQWAGQNGALEVALAVTAANSAARALYAFLGMQVVESYHYRQLSH